MQNDLRTESEEGSSVTESFCVGGGGGGGRASSGESNITQREGIPIIILIKNTFFWSHRKSLQPFS